MKKTIGYWLLTALTVFTVGGGGVADVMRLPDVAKGMTQLGYPAYAMTIIGVAKLLGSVTIVVPGFSRLKEWAYAGMVIDLVGASLSHAAVGNGAGDIITPLVISTIVLGSWGLRPTSRKLTHA